ncbi:hypothetical protein [Microcella sp.]|uniref:hypothetical protein n=1 Tax=Microcella sp. TaxID=1913979 RepID=UPI00391886F4
MNVNTYRRSISVWTTALLAATAILVPAGVVHASETDVVNANEISDAVADAAPVANVQQPDANTHTGDLVYTAGEIDITVPTAPDQGLVVDTPGPMEALELGLPNNEAHGELTLADDGTAVYVDSDGLADIAVQVLDDGLRVSTILHSAESPEEYVYDLPEGTTAELLNDGSLLVISGEDLAGAVAPPWAKDSNGASVPTRYEVTAEGFVQIVEHHGAGFEYPIVADPSYSYCALGGWYPAMCVKYNRSEVAFMASIVAGGAGAGAVGAHLCTRAPHLAIRAACIAAVATLTWANLKAITDAQSQRRCLSFAFTYPPVAQLLSGGLRVVRC